MFRVVAISAVLFASACGVGESDVVTTDDSTATTDQEVRKNNPCMTVRCAAGTHCEAKGKTASCVPDKGLACSSDADCRLFDNYCDGCACNALSVNATDPVCGGTLVQCFAQPCANRVAACVNGTCQAI